MTVLQVVEAGPEQASALHGVIIRAFSARPRLDPPSTALDETVESVAAVLGTHGGLLVLRDGRPVGGVLFDTSRPGRLGLTRVAVDPGEQSRGVASAMVGVAEDVAEAYGYDAMWLDARDELPDNVRYWTRRGFLRVGNTGTTVHLAKSLWLARALPQAYDTHHFGVLLASLLRPGDVVCLSGELGAGKTTLAQGIGAGLEVRGDVTSPTYVISRVHPSLSQGPSLVHVDAYRLGGSAELDDLDLDASVEESVTVVEWGEGLVGGLAVDRLDVRLDRLLGDGSSQGDAALARAGPNRHRVASPVELMAGAETRVVSVRPRGARWVEVPLRSTLLDTRLE